MNKVILITGGARRLGRQLALDLSKTGATIAIHYHRSQKEAKDTEVRIQKTGRKAEIFQADMRHVASIEKMVRSVIRRFKRIDALINNAAVFYKTPFGHIGEKVWDHFLDTNLKGPFFCAQAVAKQMMRQKGDPRQYSIINIADSGGPRTRKDYLPYWISKAGLIAMTETMAKIFTPGIRVNTIAPGPILFPEDQQKLKNQMPVDPSDISQAVVYLVHKAPSITGNTLIIDGGRRYL